jgi:hypothetical protein
MRPYSRRRKLFAALLAMPLVLLPLGCGSGGGTIPAPLPVQSRAITEWYPVYKETEYRYTLYTDLTESSDFELRYQGALLVLNQDYLLNRREHYFQLLRPFPQDSAAVGAVSLQAKYTPVKIPFWLADGYSPGAPAYISSTP